MDVQNLMTEAQTLVEQMRGRGLTLEVLEGGKVKVSPAGAVEPDEKKFIVKHSAHVISAITGKPLSELSFDVLAPEAPRGNPISGAAWMARWALDSSRRGGLASIGPGAALT